jgi:DNA-binding transcriptional LysR family regulator
MELRHLRYFIALAEELHFGRAAERIGIEQSPLSRAIRELEGDLGVRLFTRTSRTTRITPAGETFLVEARRILKSVSAARKATLAVAIGARGRLRIGISESIAQPRLARLLVRCRVEQPDVEFIVLDRSERRQALELRHGSLDIGLGPTSICTDGLRSEPLWCSVLAVLLPPNHPLTSVRHVPIAALHREPKIICHPEIRHLLEGRIRQASTSSPLSFVSVPSLPTLLEMVGAGLAVGVALTAQLDVLRRLDVLVRPLADPSPQITTHAILRTDDASENVNLFLLRARGIS